MNYKFMYDVGRSKILYWISCIVTALFLTKLYFEKTGETVYLFKYDFKYNFEENPLWKSHFVLGIVVFLLVAIANYLIITNKVRLRLEVKLLKPKERKETIYLTNFLRIVNIILIIISLFGLIIHGFTHVIPDKNDYLWNGDKIIGHSFGKIDEYTYTGCLEAFEKKYDEGLRTFEVDFARTQDDDLVLRHDWGMDNGIQDFEPGYVPTTEEFCSSKIYGKYTPLTYKQLLEIMSTHDDIWIVTDSKNADADSARTDFEQIVKVAEEEGYEDCLDRIIVQFYNEEMYYAIRNIYDFKAYIFTLYMRWDSTFDEYKEIVRWCAANDIHIITMWADLSKDIEVPMYSEKYDIDIYVHTVNNDREARDLLDDGYIKGVYTDSLTYEELR